MVYDEEFAVLVGAAEAGHQVLAWTEERDSDCGLPTVDALIERSRTEDLRPPDRHGRVVILTSGTTGTPKGAPRNDPGLDAAVAMPRTDPAAGRDAGALAAPLFHTWGFAHLALMAMLLGTTMVLRRRFDPEDFLRTIEGEHCDGGGRDPRDAPEGHGPGARGAGPLRPDAGVSGDVVWIGAAG